MAIEWKIVHDSWTKKPIGAVGFIGDDIAVIAAFYADKDHDKDGKVGLKEHLSSFFSLKNKAIAEVATHAYADPSIAIRDPSIYNLRGKLVSQFGAGMVGEAAFKIYLSTAIKVGVGRLAAELGAGAVKSFVIKNGLEKAVEAVYKRSVGL